MYVVEAILQDLSVDGLPLVKCGSSVVLLGWYLKASLYITIMSMRASCTGHYSIFDVR